MENKLNWVESVNNPNRKNNKICVYAITKNEAKFVDRWVKSMKEADYIVVLDTGSTDNTVKKLQDRGVYVVQEKIEPWRFDVARNKALALVPKEYNILVSTDLDEVLEPGWAKILRSQWIEGVHERARYKYSWSHLADGSSGRVFNYNKIHSWNWIWRYPVHELLWNVKTQSEKYPREQELNLFDKIHLHHYPDYTKSRSSYLPLLELRAQEAKEDWYGLIYLAHEYYYRKFYDKSIDTLNYILNNFKDKYSTLEQASCYLFLGDDYKALEKDSEAIESYKQAIELEPTYREPYLNLAKVYLKQKEYDLAYDTVITALRESYRHYTWLERDISWTYEPYDLLCLICFYGNRKKESIVYAAKALSYEPTNERLKNNLDLCIQNTTDKELL